MSRIIRCADYKKNNCKECPFLVKGKCGMEQLADDLEQNPEETEL